MRRFYFLLVATALVVAMLTLAGLAAAQTPPTSASPTDACAVASSVLAQLPPAPMTSGLAAAPPSATQPSATPAAYHDTVLPGRGIEISAGTIVGNTRFGATFVGEVAGDLPGNLIASVNYTPPAPGPNVTNDIVGGEWALCGAQGTTVFGSFTGGTVRWNADGTLADITANMNVLGGAVNGVSVSGGTGTFSGVLDHGPLAQGLPPTVSGALQLQTSGAPTTTNSGALPSTGGPSPTLALSAALLLVSSLLGFGILRRLS